jgi:hypothetical protein
MLRRGRGAAAGAGQTLAYQGAGASNPVTPPQYNPTKVGNDASARPWEGQAAPFDAGAATGVIDPLLVRAYLRAGRALPAIARGVATAGGVRCDLRQFSRDRRGDGTGFAVRARAARLLGHAIDGRARPRDPAVAPPVTFDEFKGVRLLAAHVHGGSLPHFTNKQVTNLEEVKGL